MSGPFGVLEEVVRPTAKRAAEFLAARAPALLPKRGRLILAYHGVRPDPGTRRGESTLHIDADVLHRQLFIASTHADVVPLTELLTAKDSKDRLVAITFDDAYLSCVRYGLPLCQALGIHSCVFVAPALLGLVPKWDRRAEVGPWSVAEREKFLWQGEASTSPVAYPATSDSDDDVRIATAAELRRSLVEAPLASLGNHTQHHLNLATLSRDAVVEEISTAHLWLQDFAADRYVPIVAYPFGLPPDVLDFEGIPHPQRFGLLARGGWLVPNGVSNRFAVPRWNVTADVTVDGFQARLRGRLSRTLT